MTTIGSRNWRPGAGKAWDDEAKAPRPKVAARGDEKLLARADASLAESERRVSRQVALLSDLRAAGVVTTEVEKSLIRLEAAVLEQRASRETLLAKARATSELAEKAGLPPG